MDIVIDCNFFPSDREELKLALRRAFKFVINKEKKTGNEIGRETELVFFDLDTGKDKIEDYFQEGLFGGKIEAYHILLTLEHPPLENNDPEYDTIKLFLDYLDKNQLGRKISYFNCVEQLFVLLKGEELKKRGKRSYKNTKKMFYEALQATFANNMEAEKIIQHVQRFSTISSSDPKKIFFECTHGNKMGSDLNDHNMLRNYEKALQGFFDKYCAETSGTLNPNNYQNENHPLKIVYQNRFVALCRDIGGNLVEDVFKSNWQNGHPVSAAT